MINLPDSTKAAIEAGMNSLHNFFAKTLLVRKEDEKTIIEEKQSHSFLFNAPTNTVVKRELEFVEIKARIYYGKIIEEEIRASSQAVRDIAFPASLPQGWVRIITDLEGSEILKDAKKVIFESETYDISGLPSRHGLTEKNFYAFNLKPSV